MKTALLYVAATLVTLAVIVGIIYTVRAINYAATPIQVSRPEPGYICFTAIVTDGIALSCIAEPPK